MTDSRFPQLIDALAVRMARGDLTWRDLASDEAFHTDFPNASLIISQKIHRDGEYYQISLMNSIGNVVDSITDRELDRDDWPGRYNAVLSEIYRAARRNALKADETFQEVLARLAS